MENKNNPVGAIPETPRVLASSQGVDALVGRKPALPLRQPGTGLLRQAEGTYEAGLSPHCWTAGRTLQLA